mgnify:CR=1 FL=1
MYYFLNVKHYEQKNVDDNNHPHLQFIKSPRNFLTQIPICPERFF